MTYKKSKGQKKKPKQKKRKTLIKELDAWYSRYIRWSNADSDGLVQCATCDTKKPVKGMQCGHFMSRRHYSTRWIEKNTAPQCYGCNIGDQGRQYLMSKYLDHMYGKGTAEAMYQRSLLSRKYTNEELIQLTKYYKNKTDEHTNKHS
jgi:hypothetical protein